MVKLEDSEHLCPLTSVHHIAHSRLCAHMLAHTLSLSFSLSRRDPFCFSCRESQVVGSHTPHAQPLSARVLRASRSGSQGPWGTGLVLC